MAYFVDEPDDDVGPQKAHFSDKPHEVRRIEKAHFIDQPATFDALLKSVRADPVRWRRRLGVDGDMRRMDREIAELQRKLDFIKRITPPARPSIAAMNGHNRRTAS